MENFNQQMELVAGNQQFAAARGWAEGENGQTITPQVIKGSWKAQEDTALIEMINVHGEGNWAAIATGLPGRTGKQCRERWINNLRPDIQQRNLWTEEEDRALIEAHKVHGNRWSAIARCLGGRSHNSVKNHWHATIRSLGVQRWVKKKSGQVPFGHVTILEKYILNLYKTVTESELLDIPDHDKVEAFSNTANFPGAAVPPPEVMDGRLVSPNVLAPSASYNPPETGMSTNPTSWWTAMPEMQGYSNACNEPQVSYNLPSFMDDVNWPMQQDTSSQDPLETNINFSYPFSENVDWQSSNQGCSNVLCNEAGTNSISDIPAQDDNDILHMASMNIFTPEYDDTLDPTNYI